jgi:pimeloyl-ACP methyl ester carboxylesterase
MFTKNKNPNPPLLDAVSLVWHDEKIRLPYLLRKGTTGPTILFIHGLGGAKENFYAAFQSSALMDCELLAFDLPGTGLSEFDSTKCSDVSALAELVELGWKTIAPGPAFVVAASMGGLIALLLVRRNGHSRLQGLINIEGNLAPEDCMFSRRVASASFEELTCTLFNEICRELKTSLYPGDHMTAHNMALNVDVRAYYSYSFQTVQESDSGHLLEEFINLRVPRMFLYGDANRHLSYLSRLRQSDTEVCEIAHSGHFLFYDNPVQTYQEIGRFVANHRAPVGP